MPSFPKPEKGVPRYELRTWTGYGWVTSWGWTRSRMTIQERWAWMESDYYARSFAGRPAYIYDRKTGEVIATNQEQLESND